MRNTKGELKDSYWTSYSLKHPVDSCLDIIGRNRIVVYANDSELPARVMGDLRTIFEGSNSGDLRPHMRERVERSEKLGVPLACIILGKA